MKSKELIKAELISQIQQQSMAALVTRSPRQIGRAHV